MMSEFIMGNESQKKNHSRQHSSSGHWRAVRTRGSPPAPRFLSLGSLPPRGTAPSSSALTEEKGPASPWSPSPTGGRKPPTSPGAPALRGRGPPPPQLQAELPSSAVPRANPGGGRHTRVSQCPEVGAGAGPPEDAGGARGGGA